MSRIDDALRLADGGSRTAPSQPQGSSNTFVSPWSLTEHAPEANPIDDAPLKAVELPRLESAARLRVVRPAAVDSFDAEWRPRLATGEMASPAVSQQFRRLAAALIQAQRTRPIKTVLVTSAVAGDGKTL